MTTTTFRTILEQFNDSFETAKRTDDSAYTRLKEGRPDWMQDAVHSAHTALDDRLPDDWVYEHCSRILSNMLEYGDLDDGEKARDTLSEIADGLADVYNSDLTKWLAAHGGNPGLCDAAVEEYGQPDSALGVIGWIQYGQNYALNQIGYALIGAIEEQQPDPDETES